MRAYVIKNDNGYLDRGFEEVSLIEAEFYPTALKARKNSTGKEKVVAIDVKIVERIK